VVATPAAAVGPAIGGVILGALGGSLAGWATGAFARRLVPLARKHPTQRAKGTAAA
jgi:hypothetical protein